MRFLTFFHSYSPSLPQSSPSMANALVSIVLEQLSSVIKEEIQQELRVVVGVRKEVERLSITFKVIQAVLNDAEEREVGEKVVNLWLEKLRNIAYDIEDVLDEWNTKIYRSKLERAGNSPVGMLKKVRTTTLLSTCLCFQRLGLCHGIGHKIKTLREKLDLISNEKDRFCFNVSSKTEDKQELPMTSSEIDFSVIFGRDLDKEVIVSKIMSDSSQQEIGLNVPIISIVGMGGIGKTTLAQLVYNDEQVKTQFPNRMWVSASEPFDKVRIAKAIIKNIDRTASSGDSDELNTWESLYHQLTKSVDGKLFLLVLDDIWTEDATEWDPLRLSLNYGARGSRIVITTRNEKVGLMMGATYSHRLGLLSAEDCWSLLSHTAFTGKTEEERAKLKEIGVELALKCKGLPITAKALGSLLQSKTTKQEWLNVLQSNLWNILSVEMGILPSLLLSYNDLSSHVKRCFSYCAIFPKDHEIEKDILIKMWMAQGFLTSSSIETMRDLEIVGEEYFKILYMRSLFQDLNQVSKDKYTVKMHDLVHDFAQFLTKNECFIMEMERNTGEWYCRNARHLTLIRDSVDMNSIPSSIYGAKKLRTLQLIRPQRLSSTVVFPSELFQHLTCLRSLDLRCTKLEELPSEVEKLINLRYIDLSHTSVKELPETVCNLHNIQTLKLKECSNLYRLPKGLGKLISLRHLMLDGTQNVSYLPQGIGRLSSLRTLCTFFVGGGSMDQDGCKIGELKDLKLLQGCLEIRGLGRVACGNEADAAELKNKQYLHGVALYFDHSYGGDKLEKRMESVLEGLQPHPNLKELEIHYYSGTKFPNWIGRNDNLVLSNLLSLKLYKCNNCTQLYSLGKLPNLEQLWLSHMDGVKFIDNEYFEVVGIRGGGGDDDEVKSTYPKLEALIMEDMYMLEEFNLGKEEAQDGREINFMPCLHRLTLKNCFKLKVLTRNISPAIPLRELWIENCPNLTWTPLSHCLLLPHIEELFLVGDAGDLSRSLAPNNQICHFSNLKSLTIRDTIYISLPKGLAQLTMLQNLGIYYCDSFMSLPEELQHLTTLKQLVICGCPALERRCQNVRGEDWSKISHIPNIDCRSSKDKAKNKQASTSS